MNTVTLREVKRFQMPICHSYSFWLNFLFMSCTRFLIKVEISEAQAGQDWAFRHSAHPGIPAHTHQFCLSDVEEWSQSQIQLNLDQRAGVLNPCDHLAP